LYTLQNDLKFIGRWNATSYFDKFGLPILDKREGCEVLKKKSQSGYEGSTLKDICKSTLKGDGYTMSEVNITSEQISSWNKGFDEKGKQVWRAKKGPYVFLKNKYRDNYGLH
jgi:hypothetical protein